MPCEYAGLYFYCTDIKKSWLCMTHPGLFYFDIQDGATPPKNLKYDAFIPIFMLN